LGAFGTLAAIYGYSRDNEREADENGFRMMLAAGYDIKEAPNLFRHLQEDFDKEKNGEPFFFGTHPRLQERIDSYEDLIKEAIPTGTNTDKEMVINEVQFLQLTHKLVLDNALFDISMGRFETAKQGIRKFLKQKPESTQGYYYLAEAYLHQSEQPPNKRLKDKETKEEKRQKAIEYYQKAIETDPGFPLPYKAVGILYFKEGEKDKARERLTKYLELSADGQDAAYVKGYLERLGDGKR
jgi:predicted Zn-dependent protease